MKIRQKKTNSKKKRTPATIVIGLAVVTGMLLVFACGEKEPDISQKSPKGFTFFDIGKNTILTVWIEKNLEARLGTSVRERWRAIDLEANYDGFIQTYFPDLYELSQKLKTDVVLKPEENPMKLTYRHTRKKHSPFEYVELVFSSFTKKPLLIRTRQKKEGADLLDVITRKHGEPAVTDWDENVAYGKKGRSLHWKNGKDMLMVSVIPDRYDQPEYHIVIYYVENMEEDLGIKQGKQKKRGDKVVKEAF